MRGLVVAGMLALVTAGGCTDGIAPSGGSSAGTYVLRGINGHAPPQIIASEDGVAESILAGVVILREDQTYVDSTEIQLVTASGIGFRYDVAKGTWRLSNDSVFFRFNESEYAMVKTGVELVQDFDGIELVYRR